MHRLLTFRMQYFLNSKKCFLVMKKLNALAVERSLPNVRFNVTINVINTDNVVV